MREQRFGGEVHRRCGLLDLYELRDDAHRDDLRSARSQPAPERAGVRPRDDADGHAERARVRQCTSLATGNPTTLTTTNFDGTFTLPNVPAGIPFPVVILSGRWRRQVTMTAITACGSGVLPVALGRLPRNKVEGDIPKMGIVSSRGDQLECLLRRSASTTPSSPTRRARVASISTRTTE